MNKSSGMKNMFLSAATDFVSFVRNAMRIHLGPYTVQESEPKEALTDLDHQDK